MTALTPDLAGPAAIRPLAAELLYRRCDPAALTFATTDELADLVGPVGQERAVEAIAFAVGMRSTGYNLFALGPEGTGKNSLIRDYLTQVAAPQKVPDDWVYVNDFAEAHRPRALRLPPGRAQTFRKDMERLVEDLRLALPAAFEGDEYRARKQAIEEEYKERQEEAFGAMQKRAAERHIALIRTPVGLALAPMRDGEVLPPDEFKQLPDDQQEHIKAEMAELQTQLEATLRSLPSWERQLRDRVRELDREVASFAVGHLIEELAKNWDALPEVIDHLGLVRRDVIENVAQFLGGDEDERVPAALRRMHKKNEELERYHVNVLVGQTADSGAPVVQEDHPTQPNLVGRIEHTAQFGALVTDFMLIKAGALHRANGGYLILDARKVLMQPFAWEDLKRALRTGEIRIESPGQSLGLFSTVSLEPEPIPLDLKVVLIGDPMLYYLLSHHDPEFNELFKVAADFDYRMDRSPANTADFARLLATVARRERLRPLASGAVARVEEYAARLAADTEKLSTHMASLADLVREADYHAGKRGGTVVEAVHVQAAIDAQLFRSDRVQRHIQEEVERGTLLIDTSGAEIGQINALSVLQLGRFSFGKPSRVSCRVRLGKGEVVDIEREVQLGGPIYSKGVMILASYLSSHYAADAPLSLSATLVFEQSYGGIEGDSASSTELYALLSALAEVPIRQCLAVTGSVDQHGRVQAIGGANEKIEGFFDLCRARGLDGSHGVLIPAANVKHLMLRHDVVTAAARGLFHIYPIATIDQGIAILTGLPAGGADARGAYPPGSINRRVQARLETFHRRAKALAAESQGHGHGGNGRRQ